MTIINQGIDKIIESRYEFRTFGRDLSEAAYLMSRLSVPVPDELWERTSTEIYIISGLNDINNTKIRDGKIDIKTLVQEVDGLEQWKPLMKCEFPMKAEGLLQDIIPHIMVEFPPFEKSEYSFEDFIKIIKTHPDIQPVTVEKERFGYMVNNTICEFANVWFNGAMVVSVSTESTDIEDIKKTIIDLGLDGMENINYLQAAKRIIGMSDKKLAN